MKRYLSSFTLPSKTDQEFALGKAVNRRTCYQNVYPFGVFGAWEETRLEMEPITILYGGNGSGKTTLLNLMGDALGLERRSVYNRAAFFQNFVDLCQWEGERQMPAGSAVLTSDDVFDDLLDLRSLNEGIDLDRQALLREYKDLRSQGFQLRSLDDYGHLKKVISAQRNTGSAFVRQELGGELRGKSNGETALAYFTSRVTEGRLYLLDEPENSLSADYQQALARFLEDSARFYRCQLVIATTLPSCWPSKGPRFMIWMPSPPAAALGGNCRRCRPGPRFSGPIRGSGRTIRRRTMKRDELEQCLRGWKVRLRDSAHDVEEIQRRFYASKGAAAVRSLEKNGFAAHYAASRGEAAALLLSLIPDGAVVGVGDSHTIYALDLDEKLAAKGCQAIPSMAALTGTSYDCNPPGHYRAPTREEARRILAAYLTADVFLLGANAITMTGEIVNVDGVGSRVVGGIYGPDRIVVVAGINKLVPDERAARERIAFVAAPMNNLKYDRACACVKTGRCPSCDAPNRICNVTTILHKKPMRSDYHVILIGESLGF